MRLTSHRIIRYLATVHVQPLQYIQVSVPSRQNHGVHGAALAAGRREEAQYVDVPARCCIVHCGRSTPLRAVVVQEVYHLDRR